MARVIHAARDRPSRNPHGTVEKDTEGARGHPSARLPCAPPAPHRPHILLPAEATDFAHALAAALAGPSDRTGY